MESNFKSFLENQREEIIRSLVTLASIPAPTFLEHERAICVKSVLNSFGLTESIQIDATNSVSWRIPGLDKRTRKKILLTAHLDEAFIRKRKPKRIFNYIFGTGVLDNCIGVIALIYITKFILNFKLRFKNDIIFAATAMEEGAGRLEGVKSIVREIEPDFTLVIDGTYPYICTKTAFLRRFAVMLSGEQRHSGLISKKGDSSASVSLVVALNRVVEYLKNLDSAIRINVSGLHSDTLWNTTPKNACCQIEIRSVFNHESIDKDLEKIFNDEAERNRLSVSFKCVDRRDSFSLPQKSVLRAAVMNTNCSLGLYDVEVVVNSELDYLLAQGFEAIAIGVGRGGGTHSEREFLDLSGLDDEIVRLYKVMISLAMNGWRVP